MQQRRAMSRVSVKAQTVLPKAVRERLDIRPGDRVAYIIDETGVRIEKAPREEMDDPFVTFSEWRSESDEAAYSDL